MVTYHEYIVKKKKKPLDVALCIISPIAALAAAYVLTGILFAIPMLTFLVPAAWAGLVWLVVRFIGSRNVEFEYLLTDCDLDVDKIINKNRRKRIISTYRKEIIAMAPVGSPNLPHDINEMEKVEVCSSMEDEGVYALVVMQDKKKVVYFQPTETMIETMVMRNPRKVFRD